MGSFLKLAYKRIVRVLERIHLITWIIDLRAEIGTATAILASITFGLWDYVREVSPLLIVAGGLFAFTSLMLGLNQAVKALDRSRPERTRAPSHRAHNNSSGPPDLTSGSSGKNGKSLSLSKSPDARRMRTLQDENVKLKNLIADLVLENAALKKSASKNHDAPNEA